MEEKECLQCKSKEKLYKLENNKYVCINCLNELAQEQNKIKIQIQKYLKEEYNIDKPYTQCKTLQSIIYDILMENNLLPENIKNEIINKAKEMMELE
jgi:hypothetical protein|nr:MAG TPA: RRN7 Zinc-finger of RNA-polymerase I-specific TFIIB, Rrn7 [Caudoviricetes sp.]